MADLPAIHADLHRILAGCLAPLPDTWQDTADASLTAAAVLVPLLANDNGVEVVLTVRSPHLRHHSGQISLPGGRRDPQDTGPAATALRESEEEIGLETGAVQLIGSLNSLATGSGFLITPVVGLITNADSIQAREPEVDEVFRVPLGFLMEPANRLRRRGVDNGQIREYVEIGFRSHRIWGATARVLVDLCDRLADASNELSRVKQLSREIAKFRKMVHDQPLKVERPWGPQ